MKNKLGLIIGMGTDCKSALSCASVFWVYPRHLVANPRYRKFLTQ
jgi:hypothetical protein